MTVTLEKNAQGDWVLYIVPDDNIEDEIIKTLDGSTSVTMAKDVKLHHKHIPNCLIISKGNIPKEGIE